MNIGEYRTVRVGNFKHLDETVNQLLAQGFQPFGSPYVTNDSEFLVCQAMVKEARGKSGTVPVGGI